MCAERGLEQKEEAAAIRYVRYVQDLLWRALTHYILMWSRHARARARRVEMARFAATRGAELVLALSWRTWRLRVRPVKRARAMARRAAHRAAGGALRPAWNSDRRSITPGA